MAPFFLDSIRRISSSLENKFSIKSKVDSTPQFHQNPHYGAFSSNDLHFFDTHSTAEAPEEDFPAEAGSERPISPNIGSKMLFRQRNAFIASTSQLSQLPGAPRSTLLPVIFTTLLILLKSSVVDGRAAAFGCYSQFTPDHSGCLASTACPDKVMSGVTESDQKDILAWHNKIRAIAAKGGLSRELPQAANMIEMEWDEELAYIAQKWADQCKKGKDCGHCRDVGRFMVGQNLYTSEFPVDDHQRGANWSMAFQIWTTFKPTLDRKVIQSYSHVTDRGAYTQLIWAESYLVGCGFTKQRKGTAGQYTYVCNYGPAGNFKGHPVYAIGTPCSKCPSSHNSCTEDVLCSKEERTSGTSVISRTVAETVREPVSTTTATTTVASTVSMSPTSVTSTFSPITSNQTPSQAATSTSVTSTKLSSPGSSKSTLSMTTNSQTPLQEATSTTSSTSTSTKSQPPVSAISTLNTTISNQTPSQTLTSTTLSSAVKEPCRAQCISKTYEALCNPLSVISSSNCSSDEVCCSIARPAIGTASKGRSPEKPTGSCQAPPTVPNGSVKTITCGDDQVENSLETFSSTGKVTRCVSSADSDKYRSGTRVQYICDEYYSMCGGSWISCEEDGAWKGNTPRCLPECGRRYVENPIGQGQQASAVGEWPWMAAVYSNLQRSIRCSGALIKEDWVIVAASCISKTIPDDIVVYLGGSDQQDEVVQKKAVSKMIAHPSYLPSMRKFDIALLKLSAPVTLNKRVQLVCLSRGAVDSEKILESGSTGVIASWNAEQEQPSGKLTHAAVQITPTSSCLEGLIDLRTDSLESAIICVENGANLQPENQSPCAKTIVSPILFHQEDGPSDQRWHIKGVSSFSDASCDQKSGNYSTFTRVHKFKEWIDQHTI